MAQALGGPQPQHWSEISRPTMVTSADMQAGKNMQLTPAKTTPLAHRAMDQYHP